MKRKLTMLALLCLLTTIAWAQDRTVSGVVTASEDGQPLPGVTVLVKGTSAGGVTDIDGKYEINVPPEGETLVFNFIGYATQEVTIGSQTTISVTLDVDAEELEEVVITSNSIPREKRTLGYAVTAVDGKEMTKAQEVNVVNSLSGKIPGVQVTGTGGGLGASSRVIIRGNKSLSGDSQPLWIVDGVPVYNGNILTGSEITGAFDAGNGAGEINPNDIESVTVLRGANAAALYGSRARNGAILITTKKGKKGNRTSIEINSSTRFDNVLVRPDFQNSYTGGTNGKYIDTFLDGWGERIEGQTRNNFQGLDEQITASPDAYQDDWLQTGTLFINTVSLSNATDNGDFRLGVTSLNQEGIVPNSELDRLTLSLNAGAKLNDIFSARVGINYINSKNQGIVASGGNTSLGYINSILNLPRTINPDDYRSGGGNQDSLALLSQGYPRLNNFSDSPWYTTERLQAQQEVERLIGNAQLDAKPLDWLSLTGRVGIDWRLDERERSVPLGTLGSEDGSFTNDFINQRQITTGLIATGEFDLTEDIGLIAVVGHEYNDRLTERLRNIGVGITVPDLFSAANAETNTPFNDFAQRRFFGVYSDLTFSYKDWLTLNMNGRNDFSSTLPEDERSYFYYSVSSSFVFTDAFNIGGNILDFGKIRASYARVGSDTDPYQLAFNFIPVQNIRGQFGQGNNFPFNDQPGFAGPNQLPPTNLTPEFTNSLELGFDATLFNDRINIDFTWYDIVTEDQIIAIPQSESTGFGTALTNLGEVSNTGIEVALGFLPVNKEIRWETTFNFTRNRFVADDLGGVDEVTVANSFSGFAVRAEVGEDLGLYGTTWLRDENTGRPIVDPSTGLRLTGESERIGDLNPDFLLGWNNEVNYKGFTLNFLIDYRQGGKIFSNTVSNLRNNGLAEETLFNREGAIVDTEAVIVVDAETGEVRDNDIAVTPEQFWENFSSSSTLEPNIFDATFVKIRELRLSYALPSSLVQKAGFKKASIGIEARNVAILYGETQHIDPESSLFQSGNIAAGSEERFGVPSTRSIGFNINIGL